MSKQVDALIQSGFSVQFYQPQRYIDSLCAVNAALEQYFGCLAGASAYLTPPHAQAVRPTIDRSISIYLYIYMFVVSIRNRVFVETIYNLYTIYIYI